MPTYSITPLHTFRDTEEPGGGSHGAHVFHGGFGVLNVSKEINLNVPAPSAGHVWRFDRFYMEATLTVDVLDAFTDFYAQQLKVLITESLISGTSLILLNFWQFFAPPSGSGGSYTLAGQATGSVVTFYDWRYAGDCTRLRWDCVVSHPDFQSLPAHTLTVTRLEIDVTEIASGPVTPCREQGSLRFIMATRLNLNPTPPAPTGNVFSCIEADSERARWVTGWGKAVKAFHSPDWTEAYTSDDHPEIDTWVGFRFDPRQGIMALLGQQGSTGFKAFYSEDGGISITEAVSLTANSARLDRDSERGYFLLLYGDGSDNLYVRRSRDGGLTYDTAEAVYDDDGTTQLNGTILDLTQDPRADGVLVMLLSVGGAVSVWQSEDAGSTFTQKVS